MTFVKGVLHCPSSASSFISSHPPTFIFVLTSIIPPPSPSPTPPQPPPPLVKLRRHRHPRLTQPAQPLHNPPPLLLPLQRQQRHPQCKRHKERSQKRGSCHVIFAPARVPRALCVFHAIERLAIGVRSVEADKDDINDHEDGPVAGEVGCAGNVGEFEACGEDGVEVGVVGVV